jgi:intron-binding protein aquarius
VPGILPHVYIWSHLGSQSKANVGLSKVNITEAERVCQLAAYMIECGVPRKSIAILTPYKGQLMLIREKLIKINLLDPRNPNSSVIISTVDRFQGDEADIVIASLVADSKSHTPFVKLVNRMIVLLSRARIGFYLCANLGYFENNPVDQYVYYY